MSSDPQSTGGRTDSRPRTDPREYERANLGCGDDYRGHPNGQRWLNVDLVERSVGMNGNTVTADYHHDLDETPWPFPDDCFEVVEMQHVLEHLDNQLAAVRELARVMKPGGIARVTCPHPTAASMAIDWTHTTPVHPEAFDHYLVADLFEVESLSVEKVRWARLVPDDAALWLSDVFGHGVVEWTAEVRVR